MSGRVEIVSMTPSEFDEKVEAAVARRTKPLVKAIRELTDQVFRMRPVITHHEAPKFFGGAVTKKTVLEYINREDNPLPAHKEGRTYFIDVGELMDWQLGLTPAERGEETRPSARIYRLDTASPNTGGESS